MEREKFLSSVYMIIKNKEGQILLQRRKGTKLWPGYLALPAGHIDKGENAYEAVIREAKEELGVDISKAPYKFIGSTKRYYPNCPDILDVYLFDFDCDISDVSIQEEEVNDVMWASIDKIKELFDNNMFEANAYFEDIVFGGNNE